MQGRYQEDSYSRYRSNGYSRNAGSEGRYYRKSNQTDLRSTISREEEMEEKTKLMIIKVGDKNASQLKSHLESLSGLIEKEYGEQKNAILKAFRACITQLPMKTHIYASLLALVNSKSFDICQDVMTMLAEELNAALTNNKWITVKIIMRFYAELVNANVIVSHTLFLLYQHLLAVLEEPQVKVERADAFAYVVMASLPTVSHKLHLQSPAELETVLAALDKYMNKRHNEVAQLKQTTQGHTPSLSMDAMLIYRGSSPYEQVDVVTALWRCILDLKSNAWIVTLLAKPYVALDDILAQQLQHEVPMPSIPSDSDDKLYPFQGPVFYIFTGDVETHPGVLVRTHLPPVNDMNRFIMSDIIGDIVHLFAHNHKECVEYLSRLSSYFDELPNDTSSSIWECIMEVVLHQLLTLPKSHERNVYYAIVIAGLCKEISDGFPSALGKSVRILFSRLDGQNETSGMDVECARRLGEWFALHLSNFKYIWKWDDWTSVLDASPFATRHAFVRELINSCLKLSYVDHVKAFLPAAFLDSAVWDPEGPRPFFKFQDDHLDPEFSTLLKEFMGRARMRDSFEEADQVLTKIREYIVSCSPDTAMQQEGPDFLSRFLFPDQPDAMIQELVVQVVMHIGSKSFSHLLNAFERNLPLLQKYLQTPTSGSDVTLRTVQLVAEFWKYHPQFLEIAIDKLTLYRVIDPKSVIAWVMQTVCTETEGIPSCAIWHYWSILRTTLRKVNLRVVQTRSKVEEERSRMEEMNEDLDAAETALASAQRDQKDTFIFLCQTYVKSLQTKLASADAQGIDLTSTAWWRWTMGYILEILRSFQVEIKTFKVTLEMLVFVDTLDPRILNVWHQVTEMYSRRFGLVREDV